MLTETTKEDESKQRELNTKERITLSVEKEGGVEGHI